MNITQMTICTTNSLGTRWAPSTHSNTKCSPFYKHSASAWLTPQLRTQGGHVGERQCFLTSAVMAWFSGVMKPRRPSLSTTAKPSSVTQYSMQRMCTPSKSSEGPPVQTPADALLENIFSLSLRVSFFLFPPPHPPPFSLAFLTSSGLQVQGEGDCRQADGLASVAARPVPVQHVEVSVGGAHQQVLLEGLQTEGARGRCRK